IRYGTAQTGSIITAAALIMIVVAGAFGFSDIVMMKYIAFGMIFALAIDATIIRMMLVPAVMHLLREDNCWAPGFVKKAYARLRHDNCVGPAFVERVYSRMGHSEQPGEPEAAEITAITEVTEVTEDPAPGPEPEPEPAPQPLPEPEPEPEPVDVDTPLEGELL